MSHNPPPRVCCVHACIVYSDASAHFDITPTHLKKKITTEAVLRTYINNNGGASTTIFQGKLKRTIRTQFVEVLRGCCRDYGDF